jgi:PleD family two-component response regulator
LPLRNEETSWLCDLYGLDITAFSERSGFKGLRGGSLGTSSIRVLVVDDVEPFRRFVVSTLQARPKLLVIDEVSDGLEAVRKAQELYPDLILLDIGLPGLNGIEAARQIRRLSPEVLGERPRCSLPACC